MPELKGIDVSSWQKSISWDKVKKAGVQFAMIRVGYSTSLDKFFKKNITNAAKQGIPCGVYLYSYAATPQEAVEEAKFVLNAIKPYKIMFPVAFDIEDKAQHSLTTAERTEIVDAFCSTIENGGYYTSVYTSLYWFHTMLDLTKLTKYDKWVAQWNDKTCTFEEKFGMWQNSNKGKISGIDGDVDTNISYKDYFSIITAMNSKDSQAVPVSAPVISISNYNAGTKFIATQIPLFSTAKSDDKTKEISGAYWIYDGKVINNRLRITNSADKVNKSPASKNVTGFIYKSDIKF